jgi:hypothetical protein
MDLCNLRNLCEITQKRRGKIGKVAENRYFCVGKMEIFSQKAIEKRNKGWEFEGFFVFSRVNRENNDYAAYFRK